jgi:cytochrome c-type biogenesis protein CcmH
MMLTVVLLLLGAALFVLYPFFIRQDDIIQDVALTRQQANVQLFKEQQAQFQQQLERQEIDEAEYQRLIEDGQQLLLRNTEVRSADTSAAPAQGLWLPPVLILAMASATFFTYQKLGAEDDENILRLMGQGSEQSTQQQTLAWNASLTSALKARVQQRPDNIYYWAMLAQSAIARGDMREASHYFASAIEVEPGDSFLLGQYAEALFLAEGSRFSPEVVRALDRAFAVDSNNQTVLGLKGIQAFENREFKLAITYWEAARQGLDPASATWQALQSGIDRVNQVIGALEETQPQLLATQIQVTLSLSPAIVYMPDQLVFVAVVRESGSPMPLAARKLRAKDLPLEVTLTDKDALMAGQNLSSAQRVRVVARLSQSGSATPEAGDWEAVSEGFELTESAQLISLHIDRQRP